MRSAGFRLAANPADYPAYADRRFAFALARDLGMTVSELRHRMTAAEFVEWQALYTVEALERSREER